MGAETPVASPGVHISLLEVFAHVFLANSIAASHANSGELTGFHEPIHRHVRDPKQASNLGDGQKLSPQRGGAGGGLRGLSHAAELYQPHSEASEADEVYGFISTRTLRRRPRYLGSYCTKVTRCTQMSWPDRMYSNSVHDGS